jgi:tellurite methyltransferase
VPGDWSDYYARTDKDPPSELLVRAVEFAPKGRALDLGCGAGVDARYLSERGFVVTAVDGDAAASAYVGSRSGGKIRFVHSLLETFEFDNYEFVTSFFTLSFLPGKQLHSVVRRAAESLSPGGVLAINTFGPRDEWASDSEMTFPTSQQLEEMMTDLLLIELSEEEYDGQTANGAAKHWHLHNVIAQRPR